jgi:hypothetical protein
MDRAANLLYAFFSAFAVLSTPLDAVTGRFLLGFLFF